MSRKNILQPFNNNHVSESSKKFVPDSEDGEMNDIEIIQKQKRNQKKSKSKKSHFSNNGIVTTTQIPTNKQLQTKEEDKDFIEFVLGTFHDFHKLPELKSFKNMTSLTLIYESIKDIASIIDNLPNPDVLKYLCLNENELKNLDQIEKLTNLEELQVNFNQIEKIDENIKSLVKLKKFWICENKIETIGELPLGISNFWIANNSIKEIPEDFDKYKDLEFLNISGNFISDLKDIFILEKLPLLKKLYISDINFGDNPICQYNNYRQIMIRIFKNLEILDQIKISPEEQKLVESFYIKRNIFHKSRILHNHKVTKMLFQLMKTHKCFLLNIKYHQARFFSQRKKMLEYAKYEKINLGSLNESNMDDINKEIDSSQHKVNSCFGICEKMYNIFKNLKKYISNLNDLFIVTNFYEFESNGNFKIEPGNNESKWVKSCYSLMKNKLTQEFLDKWKYKSLIFNHVFKVTNRKIKYLFDSVYDNLIDINNKFGDEQKYFDFFFLLLPKEILNDQRKLLSFLFEESYDNKEFFLCDNFCYLDEYELKSNDNNNKYACIICKCGYFENMIEEVNGDHLDLESIDEIKNFLKEKSENSDKKIIKLKIKNIDCCFYYYNINGLIEPEYIVDYCYEKKDNEVNNNNNQENDNGFVSSYNYKLQLNVDYETIFNLCAQHLYNPLNKIKQFLSKETINKNGMSKFGNFDELDNNVLFFVKSSVITYLSNCFKYATYQDYLNEINKINEKIKEISDLKFQNNILVLLEKYFSTQKDSNSAMDSNNNNSKTDASNENNNINNKENEGNSNKYEDSIKWGQLKSIDLFNLDLTNKTFDIFLNKIRINSLENNDILNMTKNCEYLSLSKNNIDTIDLNQILELFPNILHLDLSHNNIHTIIYKENPEIKYSLSSIDISYNIISDFKNIITLLKNFDNLSEIVYYGNPFSKKYECFNEEPTNSSINSEKKEKIINEYNDLVKKEKTEDIVIKINEDDKQINTTNKHFDYIYDCFSFSDKYRNFNDNIYFREKICKDNHYNTVVLSKKKLFSIPTIEGKKDTQVLYINLNKISKIANLSQFNELFELYIQNNKIKKIENLPETLLKLDISNNELSDLTGIEKSKNLEWFNFENNSIRSITKIMKLINIKELFCAGNLINNPKECCQLGKLKKLEIIDLTGNDVCRLVRDMRITMIYYCQLLKNFNRINVDEQERNKAKEYFTGKLTSEVLEKRLGVGYNTINLTELDLSSLKLKEEINLFNNDLYPKLTKLNLSRNIFKSFAIFGKLPCLTELNLNYNLFAEIFPKKEKIIKSQGLFGLPNLECLELAGNQLVNINGIQFFKKLKILVLRENSLAKIDCINHMDFLTFLDVSFNKLRNCDKTNIGILPSLQVFLCDNNYLKNINGFDKYISIQSFSFENNKISDFNSLEKLSLMENLKDLSIMNNPITKSINYRNTMIKMFPKLLKLDGKEISIEEKEMITLEMQMEDNNGYDEDPDIYTGGMPCGDYMIQKKLVSANYNYNIQRMQDKGLKRVNYVQIGYMTPLPIPNNLSQGQLMKGRMDPSSQMIPNNNPVVKKSSMNLGGYGNNNNNIMNFNLPQIKSFNGLNKPISSDSKKRIQKVNSITNGSSGKNMNSIITKSNPIPQPKNRPGSIQPIGKLLGKQDYYSLGGNPLNSDITPPSLNIEKISPSKTGKNFNQRNRFGKKMI